jgi:predicted regulator of Ras-like GTPase activity (Roadblock/LC7/MglB family)
MRRGWRTAQRTTDTDLPSPNAGVQRPPALSFFTHLATNEEHPKMASINESLNQLLAVEGALCAAVVDSGSGMLLGSAGTGVDMELAAAGNTEVVRAKNKTMQALGLQDSIDDILITLGKQYHIIRPMASKEGIFIYVVLDKARSNLALARRKVQDIEKLIEF